MIVEREIGSDIFYGWQQFTLSVPLDESAQPEMPFYAIKSASIVKNFHLKPINVICGRRPI